MKTERRTSRIRQIVGDFLIALAVFLFVDVVAVMLQKINCVVLKADYTEVFHYELVLCTILLLFALDFRFRFFTRSKYTGVRVVGWVLRTVIVLLTMVILFFCVKVITGSMINTAGQADHAIVLGLALENGKPKRSSVPPCRRPPPPISSRGSSMWSQTGRRSPSWP